MSSLPGRLRAKHKRPLAPDSWYWEPVEADEAFFNEVLLWARHVHDPCCGSGRIPLTAEKFGYTASGSDLVDRGYGEGGLDFFERTGPYGKDVALVLNPPGGGNQDPTLANRIVMHALMLADEVAVLVPVGFQCSMWRRDNLFSVFRPRLVLAIADRPSMPPGGTDIAAKGGTVDYCWVYWEPGYSGPIEWRTI